MKATPTRDLLVIFRQLARDGKLEEVQELANTEILRIDTLRSQLGVSELRTGSGLSGFALVKTTASGRSERKGV